MKSSVYCIPGILARGSPQWEECDRNYDCEFVIILNISGIVICLCEISLAGQKVSESYVLALLSFYSIPVLSGY